MITEFYYWMMHYVGKVRCNDMFEFNSFLLTSMLFEFYVMSFFLLFCHTFNIDYSTIVSNYRVTGIILTTAIFAPLFFVLYKKRKSIVEKYDILPPKRKIRGMILFWIFVLVSFPLFSIIVLSQA
jgi:hypothetical protein